MLIATILPHNAQAFRFSAPADAAVTLLPSNSGMQLLAAAVNIDPNPNKGLSDFIQTSEDKALIASAGPLGTIADIEKAQQTGRISVYVVRPGDTLSAIAKMFDVSVNTIIWSNNLKSARDVRPGDTLIILPISGIEHKIIKGDTLKSLAKKYDVTTDEIMQFNELDPGESLAVGSEIIIPGGEIQVPAQRSPRPSSPKKTFGGGPLIAGYYRNPVPNGILTQSLHGWNGVDIGAPSGTPIYASAAGTAIIARNGGWNGGYGNYTVITHSNGTQTLYAHMKSVVTSVGESISSGELIGYVGSTGKSTGPHLHFEARGATNPLSNCRVGTICSSR